MTESTPTLLKTLLQRRDWHSYERFRREYQRLAGKINRGWVDTCPSSATFWRWVGGQTPETPRRIAHRAVLEAMFEGHTARELLTPGPAAEPVVRDTTPPSHVEHDPYGLRYQDLAHSVESVTELWDEDVRRRDFLQGSATVAAAFVAPGFDFLVQPADRDIARVGGRKVRAQDVMLIRRVCQTARELDAKNGGGRFRDALLGLLRHDVTSMLRHGTYGDAMGRELLAATAEASCLLGWMSHDIGRYGLAQKYYTHALRFAQAAGDTSQGADIMSYLGYLARDAGDYRQAVMLTRGGVEAGRKTTPAMQAHLHGFEAWALTAVGDTQGVMEAIDKAARSFDRSSPHDLNSGSAAELTRGDLYGLFGHCYTSLGMIKQGEEVVTESLTELQKAPRSRSFVLIHAANLAVQRRDAEHAVHYGKEALHLLPSLTSSRVGGEVRAFVKNLNALGETAAIRDFTESANLMLSAA